MAIYGGILGVLWAVFILVWFVSAFNTKRTLRRDWTGGILWRLGIIIVILLLVHFNIIGRSNVSSGLVFNPALNALGVALTALGIGLAVWARIYLGRNWGMPKSVKENPELVVSGPYHWMRNPIYTGILLAALGTSLIDWWWVAIFACSAVYFIIAARGEEKIMLKEFPDTYPAYKARTWALIPWVW